MIPCSGGFCFPAGTPITVKQNNHKALKNIENIVAGDVVGGYDHTLKKFAWGVVKATKKSIKRGLVSLFAAGTLIAQPTLEHPVWTENHHDYVAAQDLKVGDTFRDANGSTLRLDSLAIKPDTTLTVYNFEVNDLHNYYVGTQEVLVHNDCIKVSLTRTLCQELDDLFTDKAKFIKFAQALHNYPNIQIKFKDGIYKADEIWKVISESRLYGEKKILYLGSVVETEAVFDNVQKVIDLVANDAVSLARLKDALYNIAYQPLGGGKKVILIAYKRATDVMAYYADIPSFKSAITAIGSQGWRQQQGADWVLRYLEKRMNSSTKNVIASFEDFVSEAAGEFRADITKIGGGFIELKSWSIPYINGIKNRSLTAQLGNYFNQTADFIQVFDFSRMNSSIAEFATKAKALETITKQYEDLFKKAGAYDALGGVNGKYLKAAGITDLSLFNSAVNNIDPALHKKLFGFIKVE